MNKKEKSNKKLNEHKIETNKLIRPINDITSSLSKIDPINLKINNIVEIYRDKIYEIYTNLDKQNIDFWSDEFLLADAIIKHLDHKVYESIETLINFSSNINRKDILFIKIKGINNKQKKQIKKVKEIENYIKNYEIEKDIFETLKDYYTNMSTSRLRPKDIIYSYILIKACLKDINNNKKVLNKEQEQEIIEIIEQKETECIEYQKKFNEVLILLKSVAATEDNEINKVRIKNK